MKRLINEVKKFQDDQEGSFTLFFTMTFLVMLVFVGSAIDFMRFEAERTRLQACVDNSVLAAASIKQGVRDPQEIVSGYMQTQGCASVLGSSNATVVAGETMIAEGERRVAVTADASMPMFFLPLAGINNLDYTIRSAAAEAKPNLEISMVLDISGSMTWADSAGDIKLEGLQDGANAFIDAVIPDSQVGTGNVGINLIPYARQVAFGPRMRESIFGPVDNVFSNCAEFDLNAAFGSLDLPSISTAEVAPNWTRYASNVSNNEIIDNDCRDEGDGQIVVFSDDKQKLKGTVNNLEAHGSTSIHYGSKWGFGLLDPSARPLVNDLIAGGQQDVANHAIAQDAADVLALANGLSPVDLPFLENVEHVESYFGGRPFNYPPVDETGGVLSHTTLKIAILMTDGENTSKDTLKPEYATLGGNTGAFLNTLTGGIVLDLLNVLPIFQELGFAELWDAVSVEEYADAKGTNTNEYYTTSAASTQDTQTEALCEDAKENGVLIFTIAYDATSNGQDLMSECATSEAYYFEADTSNIVATFDEIATTLTKLKLTQ